MLCIFHGEIFPQVTTFDEANIAEKLTDPEIVMTFLKNKGIVQQKIDEVSTFHFHFFMPIMSINDATTCVSVSLK